jgi:hypothetical protein
MTIPTDPGEEFARFGHNPRPCVASRADCPDFPHCATCRAPIAEGYRAGYFGQRIWTHRVSAEMPDLPSGAD